MGDDYVVSRETAASPQERKDVSLTENLTPDGCVDTYRQQDGVTRDNPGRQVGVERWIDRAEDGMTNAPLTEVSGRSFTGQLPGGHSPIHGSLGIPVATWERQQSVNQASCEGVRG